MMNRTLLIMQIASSFSFLYVRLLHTDRTWSKHTKMNLKEQKPRKKINTVLFTY